MSLPFIYIVVILSYSYFQFAKSGGNFQGKIHNLIVNTLDWEYSKKLCEENSEIDAVVSCLTFHEVKDHKDKTELLKEALRVIKADGAFVFLNLFMDRRIFGEKEKLMESLREYGIRELKVQELRAMIKLPGFYYIKKCLVMQ